MIGDLSKWVSCVGDLDQQEKRSQEPAHLQEAVRWHSRWSNRRSKPSRPSAKRKPDRRELVDTSLTLGKSAGMS